MDCESKDQSIDHYHSPIALCSVLSEPGLVENQKTEEEKVWQEEMLETGIRREHFIPVSTSNSTLLRHHHPSFLRVSMAIVNNALSLSPCLHSYSYFLCNNYIDRAESGDKKRWTLDTFEETAVEYGQNFRAGIIYVWLFCCKVPGIIPNYSKAEKKRQQQIQAVTEHRFFVPETRHRRAATWMASVTVTNYGLIIIYASFLSFPVTVAASK